MRLHWYDDVTGKNTTRQTLKAATHFTDFWNARRKNPSNLRKRSKRIVIFGIPSGLKSESAGNESSAPRELRRGKVRHDCCVGRKILPIVILHFRRFCCTPIGSWTFSTYPHILTTPTDSSVYAGVAQGSKIGPMLFNIYVNDIPSPRNCQTRLCLFADDTAVMSTGESNKVMEDLNNYLEQLGKWLIIWKIKVNTEKCQAVYFTKRRKVPDPPKLYRRAINWSKDTKYLGVTLDSRLTYDKHITNVYKQTRSTKARLYPLLGRNSKLSLQNKLLLYKTILRPKMTCASPVWGAAAHSHIQKLEATQNIIARQIINAHWFIRNRYILKDLRLPPVISHIKNLANRFFYSVDNHTNQAIKDIPTYDPSNPRKKKRPRTLLLAGN
ncbi:putative RNA-directed DNA polymerase from transposon X-element [Araneus ventricosus]|uniref:Putative RNA-directed DNA polymerase from transposon X-element n=1 Tax=Araneus ventricosus TaxID=182803 RepID=A0A4Y2TI67_ARAVE|nr:putative RNA-directed DNA polymerase from transposon X-element [Araneus ventricosus]